MSSDAISLRERKKAKTRAALISVSQRLFMEHGYSETTLERISSEVEIRAQTLLRYFDSKAHLAVAPTVDRLAPLTNALRDPKRTLDAIDIWRAHFADQARMYTNPATDDERVIAHNRRVWESHPDRDPTVAALVATAYRDVRDDLARAIAADRGLDADDLEAVLVAALLVAGRSAVYERWGRNSRPAAEALLDDLDRLVEFARCT